MNFLSYRWRLRRLQRQRAKTLSAYHLERDQAEKDKKSSDEIAGIIAVEMHEMDMIDEEIESLEGRYLLDAAQKLFLPTPEPSQASTDWYESRITGRYRLSLSAMTKLRAQVRKYARNERTAETGR